MPQLLKGQVAVVAGATRGSGRGIAVELGAAGATVYCTGRSVKGELSDMGRSETIDETAELVSAAGGTGIAVQVDHSEPEQVEALFERLRKDEGGRLDVLVNDIWGGDALTHWGPFWEHGLSDGLKMQRRAIHTHLITSHFGVKLMLERNAGLIIEVTDGNSLSYRGSLYYDLAKVSVIRLARSIAADFERHGKAITALALTPGFLRSEAMLEHFGVSEANWQGATQQDPHFAASETPRYIGRAVAALAADPKVRRWAGQALSTWELMRIYDFEDIDGRQPDWGRYFELHVVPTLDPVLR